MPAGIAENDRGRASAPQGGGAILRLKPCAALNIGIDRDPAAVETVDRADLAEMARGYSSSTPATPSPSCAPTASPATRLVYCDPPYLLRTRSSECTRYKYELADKRP